MKQLVNACLVCCLISIAFSYCMKNNSNGKSISPVLTLSSTNVKRGEPLLISTNLTTNNNVLIRWDLKPSANTTMVPANNQAVAFFGVSGRYGITASYFSSSDTTRPYDSSSSQVYVNDSISTGAPVPDGRDTADITGDEITLIPTSATDSGLLIVAKTNRLYNCAPYLTDYSWTPYGPALSIDFNNADVVESKFECMGAKNPAVSYLLFNPFPPGNYDIDVSLNQVDYRGSLTVTNTNYLFNWKYSNGVIISPAILKKQ